jgi:hypothetical protein
MEALTAVCAVLAVLVPALFQWVKASPDNRDELKKLSIRITAWLMILGIIGNSFREIALFGMSDAPMTRLNVLWLLLNCFNLICYTAVVIFIRYTKAADKAARLAEQA